MIAFLIKRLAVSLLVLLAIASLCFLIVRLTPGGPFDRERRLTPEARRYMEQKYGLDKPLHVQYLRYLGELARFNLGKSDKYPDRTVNEIIAMHFPYSFTLGGLALLLAIAFGLPLGLSAARHRGAALDHVLETGALFLVSIPGIVVGPLLIVVFAFLLGLLPAGLWAGPQHLVLPVLTLALPYLGRILLLTREKAIGVLGSEFVRAAYARGMTRHKVFSRHILKNSLIPVVAYLAPATAALLTGSIVVEIIFVLPGLGKYFVQAAINRDAYLLSGVLIVYAGLLVLLNLAADIAVQFLDPRSQILEEAGS